MVGVFLNITVITALIAAIAAIITPTITALINNKHQMKVQVKFKYICDKTQAYNEFLEAFTKLELISAPENNSNEVCKDGAKRFYASAAKIASYTTNEELAKKLYQCGETAIGVLAIYGDTLRLFNECTQMMNSEIRKEQQKLRVR